MDKDQFIGIVRDNRNLIYKICSCYCPEAEARKDLQQEILMRLWDSFEKFDGRVKVSTWIYRVALNTAISNYRKERTARSKKASFGQEAITLAADDAASIYDDEDIVLLHRFISELGEFDKALMLLYLDDNTYCDMADILGITKTNVATKINRIKKSLRERFKNI